MIKGHLNKFKVGLILGIVLIVIGWYYYAPIFIWGVVSLGYSFSNILVHWRKQSKNKGKGNNLWK